jgi:hypothetical protein
VWIHDVFAYRGLPAAWKEGLLWSAKAEVRVADEDERKKGSLGIDVVSVTVSGVRAVGGA